MHDVQNISRRKAIQWMGAGALASVLPRVHGAAEETSGILTKPIPSTHEPVPVIGMGTWLTFDVGEDRRLLSQRTKVLKTFFDLGGGLVDCSPMYGSSADTLGAALKTLGVPESLFTADKVWSIFGNVTKGAVNEQAARWGVRTFDVMQVHNLLAWREHLENLRELKQDGKIRYIGLTTSHGRRNDEMEEAMKEDGIDFVQLTYNLTHREVEQRLLPLALERKIAVIANRPYDGGRLIRRLKQSSSLPEWMTRELGCRTWADVLLKGIVSHPAVTCAIPATSSIDHMRENMMAGRGVLPDAPQRKKIIREISRL